MTEEIINLQKLPPQNIEAEQMVLGAVLVGSEAQALSAVRDILRPDDFYKDGHRKIYEAMLDLYSRNEPIDLITLTDAMGGMKSKVLESLGGTSYLANLVSLVPTASNIRSHAKLVARCKQLRGVLHVCSDSAGQSYSGGDPDELIADMIEKLNNIRRHESSGIVTQQELVAYSFSEVEKRYENRGKLSGIPTGIDELDGLLDGLQPSDLIIVAGRPSMGKSAFAETIADNIAAHYQAEAGKDVSSMGRVGYVSIEMGKRQLALRILSRASGVSNSRLRRGDMLERDWQPLANGAGKAATLPIVWETAAFDERSVDRSIDVLVQQHGCRIVLVDYLQLMQSEGEGGYREQEVARQSKMLKRKAKHFGIPVVALSQLNRAVEGRVDKRPMLADLRESGSLEQDADVVMFIYREEVYKKCECPWDGQCLCGRRGKAEIIVAKQRMGPLGKVDAYFNAKITRFENAVKGSA